MARLFVEVHGEFLPVVLEGLTPGGIPSRVSLALSTSFRRCSKKNCAECPHGPYAYVVVPRKRSTRPMYLGKLAPQSADLAVPRPAPAPKKRRRR